MDINTVNNKIMVIYHGFIFFIENVFTYKFLTTGTMVAYPFYLLSIIFRKKFIFIETFGRANMPTVAGKMMEKHSDLFIVQWESQKKHYKKAIYGGCLY